MISVTNMKLLKLLLLCFGISIMAISCSKQFNHAYQISKEYDQSEDRTYFRLQKMRVVEQSSPLYQSLDFSPHLVRSSKLNEDGAYLLFYGSDKAKYKDDAHLEISAGGEKLELSPEDFGRSASEENDAVLLYKLSLDRFQRVVSAKEVDMSLGDVRFQMKADQLEALRDLYNRAVS